MSHRELLEYCREMHRSDGIRAFTFEALTDAKSLYWALYKQGLTQAKLLAALGLTEEYRAFKDAQPIMRAGGPTQRWTWERILEAAKAVHAKQGFLPPGGWFQANGYGSLVGALYNSGRTWDQLQAALGDTANGSFVESRNGMRWRSHPEASLSNFLYARGIEHRRGDRYPAEYAKQSSFKYGYFDLHFRSDRGDWIDVEIWGDKPLGHDESEYQTRRLQKEKFNAKNTNFLGIHYKDCFKEQALDKALRPHLAIRAAFKFDGPTDTPDTHDTLVEHRRIACALSIARSVDA